MKRRQWKRATITNHNNHQHHRHTDCVRDIEKDVLCCCIPCALRWMRTIVSQLLYICLRFLAAIFFLFISISFLLTFSSILRTISMQKRVTQIKYLHNLHYNSQCWIKIQDYPGEFAIFTHQFHTKTENWLINTDEQICIIITIFPFVPEYSSIFFSLSLSLQNMKLSTVLKCFGIEEIIFHICNGMKKRVHFNVFVICMPIKHCLSTQK